MPEPQISCYVTLCRARDADADSSKDAASMLRTHHFSRLLSLRAPANLERKEDLRAPGSPATG